MYRLILLHSFNKHIISVECTKTTVSCHTTATDLLDDGLEVPQVLFTVELHVEPELLFLLEVELLPKLGES